MAIETAGDNALEEEVWEFQGTPEEIANRLLAWLRACPRRPLFKGAIRIRIGSLTIFDDPDVGSYEELEDDQTIWCDTFPMWTDFEARHLALLVRLHRGAFLEALGGQARRGVSEDNNRFVEAFARIHARVAPHYEF